MTNLEPSIAAASLVTVPALTDGVVSLRKLEARDAEQLRENCLDSEAVRWTTVPLNYSAEDAEKFIGEICPQGWANGSTHTFAIADALDDRLLGTIDLHSFRAATADVGINLGPAARGSGAALRAVELLLDYAFNGLNLSYLYWHAYVPNWGSRKLAWKAGFQFDAQLPGFADVRGVSSDAWLLSLASADQDRARRAREMGEVWASWSEQSSI